MHRFPEEGVCGGRRTLNTAHCTTQEIHLQNSCTSSKDSLDSGKT
jgi:hypothetical protein